MIREKTNPPYSSAELNLEFSEYANSLAPGTNDNPSVSCLAIVGGLFDKYPQKEAYMSAMVDLADLMSGPLWQKAVKLPMHLRANLPPAHDEIRPETA